MKKILSILSVAVLLMTALLVGGVPTLAADQWVASAGTTVNTDGTATVPNDHFVTLNEKIDFTAKDLDVSIQFKAPFTNPHQLLRFFVTKDIPTAMTTGKDILHMQYYILDEKLSLHYTNIGDVAEGMAYGGGFLDHSEERVYTLRLYRDVSGDIYVEMKGYGTVYFGDWLTKVSDLLKGIGEGYISVGVTSWQDPVSATVLYIGDTAGAGNYGSGEGSGDSGDIPDSGDTTPPESYIGEEGKTEYTEADWNATGVLFNSNGTITIPVGGSACLKYALDLTKPVDVTLKLDVSGLTPGNQDLSSLWVFLTGSVLDGTDMSRVPRWIRGRFYTTEKSALAYAESIYNDQVNMAYGGTDSGEVDLTDVDLRIVYNPETKEGNWYLQSQAAVWGSNTIIGELFAKLGDYAYLTVGVGGAGQVTLKSVNHLLTKSKSAADDRDWKDVTVNTDNVKLIGRADAAQNGIALDWGMTGIEFNYKGTASRVQITAAQAGYAAVYVNGQRTEKFELRPGIAWYTLTDGTGADKVTNVRVVKLNEAMLCTATVTGLQVEGELAEKPADKELAIEVLGDSISVGFGVIGTPSEGLTIKNEDGAYTYGSLLADKLNADLYTVAASGYGIYMNNGGGLGESLADLYEMAQPTRDKSVAWKHDSRHPDVILVGLGTNDATNAGIDEAKVAEAVKTFIARLKAVHPNAKIVWAYGLMNDSLNDTLKAAVEEAANGSKDIVYVDLPDQLELVNATGAVGHPNAACNEKVADLLLPTIQKLLDDGDDTTGGDDVTGGDDTTGGDDATDGDDTTDGDDVTDDNDKVPATGERSVVGALLALAAAACCVLVQTRRKNLA